ncbi:BspA family leucine-rich repeat surface protein [Enterococcus faecium]|uniref:BspA family leucine-rich repeat surface protein n=1 Tax=Enterococcus faecium TaxID=1352 RepID=UPI001911F5E6|nr:BspA family leucine-rich repeat surface protein [Enterococcus faecium]MBK5028598.1 BspA family leucine-rich repeat surface protein [Enterococcus faecium]MBK5044241.1 BspA family leucine-rich repeat surface protein [Enterococcus faecium]MBK5132529.1 BspA family leucine-rich repeat surface protein [Enterococcus faecium]
MKINKLVCLCSTVLLGSPILTTTTVIAESIDENGWNQMTPPVGGQTEPNTLLESKVNIPTEGTTQTLMDPFSSSETPSAKETTEELPKGENLETSSSSVSETGEEETNTSSTDNEEEANESNSSTEEAVVPSDSAETVSSEEKTKNASTAKATTLADWAITVSGTDAEITGYVGSDADRVIPTLEDLKAADPATYGSCTQAVIGNNGLSGAAKNATSLSMSTNGSKVKYTDIALAHTFEYNDDIVSITLNNLDISNVTDMALLFSYCNNLTSVDLSNLDTSNVTTMSSLFQESPSLKNINLGGKFNTSNVTSMNGMFNYIPSLTILDLSNFNTANVTNMKNMFTGCTSLTSLDLSNFNTSNVTNMSYMFDGCTSLTSLDLSNFNTSNVTNMSYMFDGCTSLTSLDLSNFNTANVTNMSNMFASSPSLTSLDLRNWDMSSVQTMQDMFTIINSSGPTPLLIKIDKSNTTLLNYNYHYRCPWGPYLNPKDGSFSDNDGLFYLDSNNSRVKSYFGKVALTTEEYAEKEKLDNFKKFIQDNTPTKSGVRFGGWQDAQGNTPDQVTNPLDQLTTIYMAQWKQDPNAPQGSVKPLPNSQELLSLYYLPTQFSIPTTQLNQAGEQIIPFDNGNNFHVGIKDIQSGTSWQLNAQLVWNTPGLETSYIQTKNTTGQVNENQNDGRTDVKDTDFQTTTDVVGEKDVIISETETTIMKSDQTNLNGFYDYALGQADLVIPDAKMIQPNNYKGTINWNLIQAP